MALVVRLSVLPLLCVCVCVCLADHYSVLGVPRSASEKQIKKAFYKLARKLHPDRNRSPDAQHVFTQVAQAYEVLSNREERRIYDQTTDMGKKQGFRDNQHGSHGSNLNSDFFLSDINRLVNMLRMEDDFMTWEEAGQDQGQVWTFTMWEEDDDDDDDFVDVFSML